MTNCASQSVTANTSAKPLSSVYENCFCKIISGDLVFLESGW
jgi:hypothetical protein